MLKKVFLAAAATVFLAGIALTAAPSESFAAKRSHCAKMAKAKYGHQDRKERRAYKKACKKAWKAAHKR